MRQRDAPIGPSSAAIWFWSPYSCQRLESFPPQASFPVPLAPHHECSRETLWKNTRIFQSLIQRIYLFMYIYVQIRLDTYKYIQDTFIYVQDTYNIYTPITLVMYKIILSIFSWIYIYEIFVHIHTYTYIYIHIRSNTNAYVHYVHICTFHT